MELEGPQEPQEEQQPAVPEVPAPDPLSLAAERYGLTAEQLDGAARLYDENRRVYEENQTRRRELERERIEIEALKREREQYAAPRDNYYENTDPALRPVLERFEKFEKRWEDQQRRQDEAEHTRQAAMQTASELDRSYKAVMRGVPSHNAVGQERFFEAMAELYPTDTGELPRGISPERAVFATARYLGLNVNGAGGAYTPQPQVRNPRSPRAEYVVPMTGGATLNGVAAPSGPDFSAQRPNETTEQYHQRLRGSFQDLGTMRLPDGAKVSSSG